MDIGIWWSEPNLCICLKLQLATTKNCVYVYWSVFTRVCERATNQWCCISDPPPNSTEGYQVLSLVCSPLLLMEYTAKMFDFCSHLPTAVLLDSTILLDFLSWKLLFFGKSSKLQFIFNHDKHKNGNKNKQTAKFQHIFLCLLAVCRNIELMCSRVRVLTN